MVQFIAKTDGYILSLYVKTNVRRGSKMSYVSQFYVRHFVLRGSETFRQGWPIVLHLLLILHIQLTIYVSARLGVCIQH
jgi:hypothetical protein